MKMSAEIIADIWVNFRKAVDLDILAMKIIHTYK